MKKRYIEKLGAKLSPLGFGVMRLPMKGGEFPEEVYRLLDRAVEKGINYFDTAYPYLGGKSEVLVREALVRRYPRDSFYIADKLPVWLCRNRDDMERIFQVQLERLGTEYIDFYLLHGLHKNRWEDIRSKGVLDFLEEKKKEGRIRRIGFSFHDTPEVLGQIVEAYPWEFAQLQINYYDWTVINTKACYEILEERGIPCMIMEPVGGGRLSRLPDEAERILKKVHPERSAASWAIRFAASLPNAAVTLSGMSDTIQLDDNVNQFQEMEPWSKEEGAAVEKVVRLLESFNPVPCSGCRYCVEECPRGVDIPQIFKRYNDYRMFEGMARFDIDYFAFVPEGKRGDSCIRCGKCSARCPQKISVPEEIGKIHAYAVGLQEGSRK